MEEMTSTCHICESRSVKPIPGFGDLFQVTSDCRLWKRGGVLNICKGCGTLQKPLTAAYENERNTIFDTYQVYYQSQGAEQRVFQQEAGTSQPRSVPIIDRLTKLYRLPETGELLDIGCGNGSFLRSFSRRKPSWRLSGLEVTDTHKQSITEIENVVQFYIGDLDAVDHTFDAIALIHTLEHISDPIRFLTRVRNLLKPTGVLLIQVPDYGMNSFDLIIADHCSHFTKNSLQHLVDRSRYQTELIDDTLVPKELTLIAVKNDGPRAAPGLPVLMEPRPVEDAIGWLSSVAVLGRRLADGGNFGIFGTSIAASWIFGSIENGIEFFVDEDPGRIGRLFFERPVHHPRSVPGGSHVYIVLPHPIAQAIADRVRFENCIVHIPPAPETF
jgi:SAM-dependent methyltransferase